jgi:hypothetical protein
MELVRSVIIVVEIETNDRTIKIFFDDAQEATKYLNDFIENGLD